MNFIKKKGPVPVRADPPDDSMYRNYLTFTRASIPTLIACSFIGIRLW